MRYKIGDICDILNGFAFKSSEYVEQGIRIIRIANVQKGLIEDSSPQYYPIENESEISSFMLLEGDLLVSLTGNVGRVGLLPKELLPAALNQRVGCLRIKDVTKVNKEFLFYALNNAFFESKCIFNANGVAQKNMSTVWLSEYEIDVPTLKVQNDICRILSLVDELINIHYQQIRYLDDLIKSRFVEMFGDISLTSTMQEVCKIITDGTHQPPKFVNEGIPFIFVSNIANDRLTYNAEKFISEETYNELVKRTPIEIGDVLLSTVGSYGHPAIVESNRKFLFQRHIAYLKPDKDKINCRFLHAVILSDVVKRQIDSKVKGIAQKTLNLSEIKSLQIPLPPLNLQNQFAAFVEQTEKSKAAVQQCIDTLQTLKASLMQEYFG